VVLVHRIPVMGQGRLANSQNPNPKSERHEKATFHTAPPMSPAQFVRYAADYTSVHTQQGAIRDTRG
jgi:hypothetical protein